MPGVPNIPSGAGLRQQRAAQLKSELEAGKQKSSPAGKADYRPVRSGETLEQIAAEYNLPPEQIWNHPLNKQLRDRRGDPSNLQQGDALYVPGQQEEQTTAPVGQGDYVVKAGDCISSIAKQTGHFWKTIWNDAGNSELQSVRKDPNVLLPGDRVTVPELTPKYESGETEMRHRFKRKGEPAFLRIQVLVEDQPLGNQPYELIIDNQTLTGTTNADGQLDVPISGSAKTAQLTVGTEPDVYKYVLRLGALEPIESIKGVQQRLNNLGFQCGPVDGDCGSQTQQAIRAFQKANGINETGQADEGTRRELQSKHRS